MEVKTIRGYIATTALLGAGLLAACGGGSGGGSGGTFALSVNRSSVTVTACLLGSTVLPAQSTVTLNCSQGFNVKNATGLIVGDLSVGFGKPTLSCGESTLVTVKPGTLNLLSFYTVDIIGSSGNQQASTTLNVNTVLGVLCP